MKNETAKTAGAESRSTVEIHLRVPPEARERVEREAKRYGHTVSEYIGALIMGRAPVPRLAVEVGPLAILGSAVVKALDELPPESSAHAAVVDLRKAIVDAMLARLPEYEARLDSRDAEMWGE